MEAIAIFAVAALGGLAAWSCGKNDGWREAVRAETRRTEMLKERIWRMAEKARDLDDFKARYVVEMALDEGEPDDGMGI